MNPVCLGRNHLHLIDGSLYLQADEEVGIYLLGQVKSFAVCDLSENRYGLNLYDIDAGCEKRIFHIGLILTAEKIKEWVSKIFAQTEAVQVEIRGGSDPASTPPDPLPHFIFDQNGVIEAARPIGGEGDQIDFNNLGKPEEENKILSLIQQFFIKFSELREEYLRYFPEDAARLGVVDEYFERLETRESPTTIEMRIFYEIVKSIVGEKPLIEPGEGSKFSEFALASRKIYPEIQQFMALFA